MTYKTMDKISHDRTMAKSARGKKLEGYTVMQRFKKSKTAANTCYPPWQPLHSRHSLAMSCGL
jgi:hypothetical protein